MALADKDDVKLYLRIETVTEDALITALVSQAIALIETYLNAPISASGGRVFVSSTTRTVGWPIISSARFGNDPKAPATEAVSVDALDTWPDYGPRIEPLLSMAIVDVVSEWWNRRNPGIASESSAGVSVAYAAGGLPPRTKELLEPIRILLLRG